MRKTRRTARRVYHSRQREKDISFKPLFFTIVILLSVAMRLSQSGPLYDARIKISSVLSRTINISDAVEAVGRAFGGEEEDNAVLVFGKMILGIDDKDTPDDTEEKSINTENASQNAQETSSTQLPSHMYYISHAMAGDISGLTPDIPESPMPFIDIDSLAYGFSEEEDYDGTPDEAFKIPSPDIVDDKIYDLPFKSVLPLSGYRVTSRFGYRIHPISGNTTFHYGADLAASSGTAVVSAGEGTISETGYGSINGNYIIVSHPGGFATHYAHLLSIEVTEGQQISCGQQIGKVGSTGYSTGPHLHFEIRKDGKVLDPFGHFALEEG